MLLEGKKKVKRKDQKERDRKNTKERSEKVKVQI